MSLYFWVICDRCGAEKKSQEIYLFPLHEPRTDVFDATLRRWIESDGWEINCPTPQDQLKYFCPTCVGKNGGMAPKGLKEGYHRVILDFSRKAYQRLQRIKHISAGGTNGRTIQRALSFFEWYVQTMKEGKEIQTKLGDHVATIEFDF